LVGGIGGFGRYVLSGAAASDLISGMRLAQLSQNGI